MKTGEENDRRKGIVNGGSRGPLSPAEIAEFKNRLTLGETFWLKTDDGMQKFSVIEKCRHFARLRAERKRSASVVSMQYTQLMIAKREERRT